MNFFFTLNSTSSSFSSSKSQRKTQKSQKLLFFSDKVEGRKSRFVTGLEKQELLFSVFFRLGLIATIFVVFFHPNFFQNSTENSKISRKLLFSRTKLRVGGLDLSPVEEIGTFVFCPFYWNLSRLSLLIFNLTTFFFLRLHILKFPFTFQISLTNC